MTDHDKRQAIPVITINLDDIQAVPDEALDGDTTAPSSSDGVVEQATSYRVSFRHGVHLELNPEGQGWSFGLSKYGVLLANGWIRGTRVDVIAAIQRIHRDLPAANP